jgi:FSR family fosmidomycin resistance protein-like MFS transporter
VTTHPHASASTGPDRGGIGLLAAGHFIIDATVGAVPALIPVFTALYALSDLAASMILGASLLISSAIQPVFGILADRRATSAFLWGGVAVAVAGLVLAGFAGGYLGVIACIVGSGLGVAAFHPEAARVTNRLSAGRPATGLAWFMVGGNAGFAAGPLLVALFIPWLDARATLALLIPGAVVAAVLFARRARLSAPVHAASARADAARADHVPGLVLLIVVTSMRTWIQFVGLALVPLVLIDDRGLSESAGGYAVAAYAAAGALGTLAGAALSERIGGRAMLVTTMPVVAPLLAGFLIDDGVIGLACFVASGFFLLGSFSVTVAMGQAYLPGRLALAAGLMIGFAAIGSAPPGLALFGALADATSREAALWVLAALPLVAGALALFLPARRGYAVSREAAA